MEIDAAGMAEQLAYYEIMPFETRYGNKLDALQSKQNALTKVKSLLSGLDNLLYDYTKATATGITQNTSKTSSDDYITVSSNSTAKESSMSLFVEQLASRHQVGFSTTASTVDDTFAATGNVTVTIDGTDYTVDMASLDADTDGQVSYGDFVDGFNAQLDGLVTASIIKTDSGLSLSFASDESGIANAFTMTADAAMPLQAQIDSASANPLKAASDAVVWLGDQGTGLRITNSTNEIENLVNGVNVTLKQVNEAGDQPTEVTVEADKEATQESLNEFIDKVNEVLTTLSQYTTSGGESSSRGILASESGIRSFNSQLKALFRQDFGGIRLYEAGIEFDSSGKLSVDGDKLEEALSTLDLNAMLTGETGLFKQIEDLSDTYIDRSDGLLTRSIETYNQQQQRVSSALSDLEDKYETYYNRYLSQFTRLNTMAANMDSITSLF